MWARTMPVRPDSEGWGRKGADLDRGTSLFLNLSFSDVEAPCSQPRPPLLSLAQSSPSRSCLQAAVRAVFVLGVRPAGASNFHYIHSSKLLLHHLPDLRLKKEESWPSTSQAEKLKPPLKRDHLGKDPWESSSASRYMPGVTSEFKVWKCGRQDHKTLAQSVG